MGLFDKLRDPIVLKEDSEAQKQLEQLNAYLATADPQKKEQIEDDIKLLQYGIYGENALMFELKNSHLPMYILHDLFYERNGLTTQIDYLLVTRKLVVIIECKNLYGNITIDAQGNFSRNVQLGRRYQKTGIYSPVTQNQRHLDMVHEIMRETKPALFRSAFDKRFDETYKSVIVLANPSTYLDMRFAPKDIKSKVIKADGLVSYLKKLNDNCDASGMSDKEMKELADFFLEKNQPYTKDYTEKYSSPAQAPAQEEVIGEQRPAAEPIPQNVEETPLYQALRSYRFNKSREEGVKPYFIFNNDQLKRLIESSPATIQELLTVSGFGEAKCKKYGADIIRIISQNK